MLGGTIAVRFDAGDLGPELRDPLAQFLLRIAVERLAGEEAGSIAFAAWAIVFVHESDANVGCHGLAVNACRG